MFRGGNMMDLSGHEHQGDGSGAGVVHQMSMQPPPMQASYPTPGAGNLLHDSKLRLLTTPPPGTAAGTNGTSSAMIASNNASLDEAKNNASNKSKKPVRYRECLKNHAASIGGHAIDGCGEFMPSGEEGSIESLKCAACDCHRNFHKREVEGEPLVCDICHMNRRERNRKAAAIAAGLLTSPNTQSATPGTGGTTPMPLATTPSTGRSLLALGGRNLEDHNMGGDSPMNLMSPLSMKKRFRTKFSMDQKERMFMFAEKLGWRIQKHDEAAVQQFCADVGVKRHVLKVWMHNNKHTFGKRSSTTPTSGMPITSPSAHPDMDSPPRHHITPPQQQQQ